MIIIKIEANICSTSHLFIYLLHCLSIGLIGPNGHKIGLLGLAGVVYWLFRPNPILYMLRKFSIFRGHRRSAI